MDKGGRWVKGSVYYPRRVIWTNSDVFWTNKFAYNIPDHDKWDFIEFYQHWKDGEFYWWHNYWNR